LICAESWFLKMPLPATTKAAVRLWTARVACGSSRKRLATKLSTSSASWFHKTQFTRGCVRELKNAHNSVTVQNRTHVYMTFFDHKDLGNHLLQECPQVVKHPVYMCVCVYIYTHTHTHTHTGQLKTLKNIATFTLLTTSFLSLPFILSLQDSITSVRIRLSRWAQMLVYFTCYIYIYICTVHRIVGSF